MSIFTSNRIVHEEDSISNQLKEARNTKGVGLSQAVKETGINIKYIEALEAGHFKNLPAGVYGRNYLREYALYLGLEPSKLLQVYDKEVESRINNGDKKLFIQQRVKQKRTWSIPAIIKNSAIIFLIAICFIYLGFYLKRISVPPSLEIIFPADDYITSERTLKVIGISDPEVQVVINGEQVFTGVNGEFNKDVFLKSGINIITISAKRKFGREKVVRRQLLVK